ncbi:MAG TPA: tRNA (N6-threonylcarbamoyladenosine(37)-N6)-methyltransferase TrmO [Chitinophagaceae bacterium]|nr:tRNA (N6-threonylcarbamoyladenosine(37)-N6)-methyltransferase TrmO [Chitinophagaceae bacterium]
MESIKFIGEIPSSLEDIKDCPLQEFEGGPQATLIIGEEYRDAMQGLRKGTRILLLTWLDKGDRAVLTTRPRNNPNAAITGVFATRSPDRPNPIGLHEVDIVEISANGEIKVSNLEVLNGTPLIDIKPVLK